MLENRKMIFPKLTEYGFEKNNDNYTFQTLIVDQQFQLEVIVDKQGELSTKVTDVSTQTEYVLHLNDSVSGMFVGRVRQEYQDILSDIIDKCTDNDIFKQKQTREVIDLIQTKYNSRLEFLWKKFPNNAVFRREDTNKWYAAILVVERNKLGLPNDELVEVIDLHMAPEQVSDIVDNINYFPGYHMNKKSWITIILDESVSNDRIEQLIENSYKLATK